MGFSFHFSLTALSRTRLSHLYLFCGLLPNFIAFGLCLRFLFPFGVTFRILSPLPQFKGAVGCDSWLDMILHYPVHCISQVGSSLDT